MEKNSSKIKKIKVTEILKTEYRDNTRASAMKDAALYQRE